MLQAMPNPVSLLDAASEFGRKVSRRLARYAPTKPFLMRSNPPLVSVTFDDVPASAAIHGAAILERHGARGTFYIAPGLCGREENGRPVVTAEGALALHRRGHEIGGHTFGHENVQRLGAGALDAGIARSRAFFRALSPDIALDNFAYPFGVASLERKLQLQRLFASCRGIAPGVNRDLVDLGNLRAVEVYDRTIDWTAIDRFLALTVRRNGWLVLYTHDVEETPSWIGCSPAVLEEVVVRARRHGCEIATVRDAMRRIGARTT